MKYTSCSDLPGHLKRQIASFGWPADDVEAWLRRPIPLLADRSILQALEDGDLESVNNVVLRTAEVMGVTGDLL